MKRVRDERSQPVRASETDAGKSDFIAAARRAAQAAAAEADVNKRKSDVGSPVKALRIGDLLKSRRKPILMAATAIMTVLAGLQLGKPFMNDALEIAGLGGTTRAAPVASAPVAAERSIPPRSAARRRPEKATGCAGQTVRAVDAPEELPIGRRRGAARYPRHDWGRPPRRRLRQTRPSPAACQWTAFRWKACPWSPWKA